MAFVRETGARVRVVALRDAVLLRCSGSLARRSECDDRRCQRYGVYAHDLRARAFGVWLYENVAAFTADAVHAGFAGQNAGPCAGPENSTITGVLG